MKLDRLLSGAALAVFALSCQSAAPPAPQPAAPRRVVLLSLDGASAGALHQLEREGALTAGGFARFFEEGQVAERLVPVNPALTSPNHISLASGYPADQTGIVGNTFHPSGSPFLKTMSGFEAPIATETLWEAVRRQGKRAGVVTWPGADDTGPRRRADWGMTYVNDPDRPSALLAVGREAWKPVEETARGMRSAVESRSPLLSFLARVGTGPGAQTFNFLAVDSTDDGQADYDRLALVPPAGGVAPVPLTPGRWAELPCAVGGQEGAPLRAAVCTVKLLELAPDLGRTRIYFGGVYPLRAYPADFATALAFQRLYWPGPPDGESLDDTWRGRPGIDLDTWVEQADRFTRFFGDSLIAAASRSDWDLLMGYMPVIDEAGHQLSLSDPRQPGFSPERRAAFDAARRRVWQAVDRELARLLRVLDLKKTVIVVVSDHGMAPVHTQVDPNVLLRGEGLLAADAEGKILAEGTAAYAVPAGGLTHVYIAPGQETLLPRLRDLFTGWTVGGERPVERVFTRQEAAAVHLDHPDSGDLILFLNEGYGASNLLREGQVAAPTNVLGRHGYLNVHPDMHGIYLALGAGIGRGSAGTVQNPEVAGRVAGWLGIEKPRPSP